MITLLKPVYNLEKKSFKQLSLYLAYSPTISLALPPVVHGLYIVSRIIFRQFNFILERFSSVIPHSLQLHIKNIIHQFTNTFQSFWEYLIDYSINPNLEMDPFVDNVISMQQLFSTFRDSMLQIQPELNPFGNGLLETLLNEADANVQRFLTESQDLVLSDVTSRISVPTVLTDEYLDVADYRPITEVGLSPIVIVGGMLIGGAILIRITPDIVNYLIRSINWHEVGYWIHTHYRPGGGVRGILHTFFVETQPFQHFQPGQPSQVPFSQNPVEWLPADDRANTTTPPTQPNTPNNKVLFIVLCVVVGVLFFL